MSSTNYFALTHEDSKSFNKMFKKILFGEKALSAMKNSNGKTVIDGRLKPVVENGKKVWEFDPYNRKSQQRKKMMVLKYLPEGWIKMGMRRIAVYSSASNRLTPEEAIAQLKIDICEGLDQVLKDGTFEDLKDYYNLLNDKA